MEKTNAYRLAENEIRLGKRSVKITHKVPNKNAEKCHMIAKYHKGGGGGGRLRGGGGSQYLHSCLIFSR